MKTWKWSTGEPYYKSARPEKQEKQNLDQQKEQQYLDYDSKQNAINQSLDDTLFDASEFDMISITNSMFSRNKNPSGNRREELDNKMSDRDMISQRGVNPFLQQTSYVNDIVTRDMFLKPINTSQEKLKTSNKEEEF
jgi:hypothetical protein